MEKNLDDKNWDELPTPEAPEKELKQLKKSLRRRNAAIILTSLVLAAALLLGAVYVVTPALETLYWDPEISNYGDEFTTDLELALSAYGQVFCPRMNIAEVTSKRTGFATYDLTISHWDGARGGRPTYTYATLTRGELELPEGFFWNTSANIFDRASHPIYTMDEEFKRSQRETLESLPEYIDLEVAVSFPEDMDMEQLLAFVREWDEALVLWIGIRNAPEDQQLYPLTGMAPFMGGYVREIANNYYPDFEITNGYTAEILQQHFISLLTFLKDQEDAGRGVGYTNGQNYYENVLSYVEENGVKTYGCMIVGPSEMFLKMLDSGVASQVWIQDAWIDA